MGVSPQMKEFNRNIEFGRILYKIVYMYNLNVYAWGDDMMEVLEAISTMRFLKVVWYNWFEHWKIVNRKLYRKKVGKSIKTVGNWFYAYC